MVRTYDPKLVVVDYKNIILSGFAEGTFVKVERNEDTWRTKYGSDGEALRVKNNNRSGKITVTLLQSSQSNKLLSAQAQLDEATNQGSGPITVADASGDSMYNGPSAWIVKPAHGEYGEEGLGREWVFECDALEVAVGGNL